MRNNMKGTRIRVTADFSGEILQARREWYNKVMKGKNPQPRILYPARISCRFEGEIKSFSDKQKLREFSATTTFTTNAKKNFSRQETQEKKKTHKNKPKTILKMVIGTYILIITLNVNGLNAPTKGQRLVEWLQKQDPYICYLQEAHFRSRDTYRLKMKGWKKMLHAKGNQKKAGVAILISDKIDF